MTSFSPSTPPQRRYGIFKAASIVVIVAVLACYNMWASETAQADAAAKEQIAEAQRTASHGPYATDGTFSGSAQGYGGLVTMQVTIDNGWIASVEIVDASQEDEAWLEMAEVLPERIVEAQTPNIDVVSGATFTSTGILNGTTEALIESMSAGGADES